MQNNKIFANILNNGIVNDLIVISSEQTDTENFISSELGLSGKWVEASLYTKNGIYFSPFSHLPGDQSKSLRGNYPEIGNYYYDEKIDAFIKINNNNEWVLNTINYIWEPPIPRPENQVCQFDEASNSWVLIDKPYDSWTMEKFGNINLWIPPVQHPEDGEYRWDEDTLSWIKVTE